MHSELNKLGCNLGAWSMPLWCLGTDRVKKIFSAQVQNISWHRRIRRKGITCSKWFLHARCDWFLELISIKHKVWPSPPATAPCTTWCQPELCPPSRPVQALLAASKFLQNQRARAWHQQQIRQCDQGIMKNTAQQSRWTVINWMRLQYYSKLLIYIHVNQLFDFI